MEPIWLSRQFSKIFFYICKTFEPRWWSCSGPWDNSVNKFLSTLHYNVCIFIWQILPTWTIMKNFQISFLGKTRNLYIVAPGSHGMNKLELNHTHEHACISVLQTISLLFFKDYSFTLLYQYNTFLANFWVVPWEIWRILQISYVPRW